MTEPATAYRIIQRNHVSQWNEQLQQAVPGWDLRVLWAKTGTVLPVFVPDTIYTAENVDRMVRDAGRLDEQMHALGG